jgi:hypothetical protein
MNNNSEKLSIHDKLINLSNFHLTGHIIALYNFKYNFNFIADWRYFLHNEIEIKFYDKTINDFKYTLENLKNTCIFYLKRIVNRNFCKMLYLNM